MLVHPWNQAATTPHGEGTGLLEQTPFNTPLLCSVSVPCQKAGGTTGQQMSLKNQERKKKQNAERIRFCQLSQQKKYCISFSCLSLELLKSRNNVLLIYFPRDREVKLSERKGNKSYACIWQLWLEKAITKKWMFLVYTCWIQLELKMFVSCKVKFCSIWQTHKGTITLFASD